jgi:sterol-4alpha-carboxylate 3-dehydrogenase (decarboxylating)
MPSPSLAARLRARTSSKKEAASAAAAATASSLPVALVTGGAGFLGRHLVAALVASASYARVIVFDVRPSPDAGVESIVGDLRDPASVRSALAGVDVVFHCATASPAAASAADKRLMTSVNVDGTRHVLDAAAEAGAARVVFTSSASVVFDGRDLDGVDEAAPYAARPLDFYTATKIEAEKLVLAANGRATKGGGTLATVALRPSGIFGEHDRLLVPTAVDKARAGKMKYVIGGGGNLMDWTYAGNVADAHVLAAARLASAASPIAGRPFFITNDAPRPFWTFMGDLLEPLGYGRPHIKLPFWPLYVVSVVVAWLSALLRPLVALPTTDFTPMRITISAATRRLDCGAAKRELGYAPRVSVDEGLARTVAAFAHLAAPGAAAAVSAKGRRARSRSRGR